jgi:hypothetical protein
MTVYYLTTANVGQYLGTGALVQLTRDSGTGGVDAAIFAVIAGAAESTVHSYLGKGWPTPITVLAQGQDAYDAVVVLCMRAFKYHALYRRDLVTDQIANDFTELKKECLLMAKGGLALPGNPQPARSGAEAPESSSSIIDDLDPLPSARRWSRDAQGGA